MLVVPHSCACDAKNARVNGNGVPPIRFEDQTEGTPLSNSMLQSAAKVCCGAARRRRRGSSVLQVICHARGFAGWPRAQAM
ncbi:hypothetical protein BN2476_720044 [Paraburkholderia piptadeniae]|uniref:Uncharacterized protein n=1 Tax=Paraburkholderia piptadeniae TaxID=1701573 RepID=A0A1N7SQY0_9BURK|nr:hypothetical protein BN2476_720044 [Paraburkholderia piptadeniae]